ncbi:MAG: c-type cytochrome [Ignavibacteria bacterium]|nr:c-type cytochrome [Ignavibacteria bacterium]
MEFLDKLVLPQSAEHIALLHYMTLLILFLFLPFISIVLGGSTLSLIYKRRGIKEDNSNFTRFSKDIIEICTVNKSTGVILGIVPILALILIFTQLLHTTQSPSVWYLMVSLISMTSGLVYIYVYRYSITFKDMFKAVTNESNANEDLKQQFKSYSKRAEVVNDKSGLWGIIFLYIATYFYIAGLTAALSSETWGAKSGILLLFTSWEIFLKWIHFLIGSFLITGALVLFNFFFWEGGIKDLPKDYSDFVKKTALTHTLINAVVLPFVALLNIFALPSAALSTSLFGFVLTGLFILFLVFHLLYDMIKNNHVRFSGWVFILVLFTLIFFVISDQIGLNNSTKKHSVVLTADFEKSLKELKTSAGGIGAISGADIYATKCAACHQFDKKLVGPAHKDVLVKYEGNVDKLVQFINNPVKVDPAFPPMPSQGLKPNEAKAVAKYVLEEVKKY